MGGNKVALGIRLRNICNQIVVLLAFFSIVLPVGAASIKIVNIRHLFDIKSAGSKPLALPADVAVNNKYIYVVDGPNHRIVAYNHKGQFKFTIGETGATKGLFNTPVGMTTHNGKIYLADTGNHVVRIMDERGGNLSSIKIFSDGKQERPIDIAVSKDGSEIFVTCNNSQKVQIYNHSGKLLRSFGKRGEKKGRFRYPATINNIGRGRKIIVDVLNARAQVFSNGGKFIRTVGGQGVTPGKLFRPKGVAIDKKGRIYISDSYMDLIQVFDKKGNYLHILGRKNKIRRFVSAAGIAIYDDRLYVTEVLENKVSVFSLK